MQSMYVKFKVSMQEYDIHVIIFYGKTLVKGNNSALGILIIHQQFLPLQC